MVILSATGCFGGQGNVFSLEVGQCFDDPDVAAARHSDGPMRGTGTGT
jgi:hypothetical protein